MLLKEVAVSRQNQGWAKLSFSAIETDDDARMKLLDRLVSSPARRDRVRRPTDILLSIFAIVVLLLTYALIRILPTGSTEISNDVSRWLRHIPLWLSSGAEVVAALGSIALIVVAVVTLIRTDLRSGVNAAISAAITAIATIIATSALHSEHGVVARAVLHGRNPTVFVVDATVIAFLVVSD